MAPFQAMTLLRSGSFRCLSRRSALVHGKVYPTELISRWAAGFRDSASALASF